MVDTTTPPAQDLQINLDEAPKQEKTPTPENISTELDLNLDLNLPDAPKDDDRLQKEDQQNNEIPTTLDSEPTIINEKSMDIPQSSISEQLLEPTPEAIKEEEYNTTAETVQPILEPSTPEIVSENGINTETTIETKADTQTTEDSPNTENITATTVEEIPQSSNEIGENVPENFCLQDDIKMIEEIEGHKAGGLAEEATMVQQIETETPKTFDLDAMLGNPTIPAAIEVSQPKAQEKPENIVVSVPKENSEVQPVSVVTEPIATPMPIINTQTIPSIITQVPVQAITQTTIPQKKNVGVKVFLFLIMFVGLGFTTFFILKTMYPIEFANMTGGENATIISENSTGEELTGLELTTTESTGLDMSGVDISGEQQISDIINTGTEAHASATGDENFGELNDLLTTEPEPAENNVSKLTDYVNQGNTFLTQGKNMNNNTVIKYGLYISKKATAFLEDIANGKEINNLTGYFAQFDQYITELQKLVENTPNANPTASTTLPTNDTQNVTTDTTTTTGFGDPSAAQ